ncbi:MAG TPA: hypothetical protein VEB87_03795 [Nitrososphaerales archaeon]|nr:hypothetical protein [Nitrososphaerales archaeon]
MTSLASQKDELLALYHRHKGACRVLVPEGTDAWRYYMVTRKEATYWRNLGRTEKDFLARLGRRGCFVCALRDVMARQERLETGLHSALMSFLLVPD